MRYSRRCLHTYRYQLSRKCPSLLPDRHWHTWTVAAPGLVGSSHQQSPTVCIDIAVCVTLRQQLGAVSL